MLVAYLVSEQASFITGSEPSSSTAATPCGLDERGWQSPCRWAPHRCGPGGLALGIFLRKAGFCDFTIFDREDGVGGTWRNQHVSWSWPAM